MNEAYDVIILGTGLKECILSGLLSVSGKKVLHLDRNDYYGAESASLNLKQLFKKFEGDDSKMDEQMFGASKSYSVDLCPKFLMGMGNLVKMLLHTKVTRYLEFRCVGGSFVYKDSSLFEVPVTPAAALNSSLMGLFQKRRYKNFLQWVLDVKEDDMKTWGKLDLKKQSMREVYAYWKCDDNTQAFTGHAIALYQDDSYLDDASRTLDCISRLQMYAWSLSRFEKSPYIYPVWGLGGLPEGFSRLAAVHGGVYMLRRDIEEIEYNGQGQVTGVKVKDEGSATCKQLIGDPSYFLQSKKVQKTGTVARWLCILDHPVEGTNNSHSAQIILPTKQTGHKSDIYVSVQSAELQVAPKGRWIAMISAEVYTSQPRKELQVAYKLLGSVLKDFFMVNDTYKAVNEQVDDNVFISSSMDASTHFEHTTKEVMKIYKQITGQDVDLNANPDSINDQ
mmetsp:Transcript_31058/g.50379  ORF Transcript_31058/g.50379 Transcript_31058/m.50379 type:complete len:449 (-) Transcript_31058:1470-2816(-)